MLELEECWKGGSDFDEKLRGSLILTAAQLYESLVRCQLEHKDVALDRVGDAVAEDTIRREKKTKLNVFH